MTFPGVRKSSILGLKDSTEDGFPPCESFVEPNENINHFRFNGTLKGLEEIGKWSQKPQEMLQSRGRKVRKLFDCVKTHFRRQGLFLGATSYWLLRPFRFSSSPPYRDYKSAFTHVLKSHGVPYFLVPSVTIRFSSSPLYRSTRYSRSTHGAPPIVNGFSRNFHRHKLCSELYLDP